MDVELVAGARTDHVLRILNEAREGLASVRNVGSNQAVDTFNAYVRWAGSHLPVLSSVVSGPTLDHLVTSRGYYLVHGVDPRALGQQLTHLVLSEVELRLRSFDAALADIRARQQMWESGGALLVPDTNVLMGQEPYLPGAAWEAHVTDPGNGVEVVILHQVLVELDRLKDRGDALRRPKGGSAFVSDAHTRTRALRVLAWLDLNVSDPLDRFPIRPEVSAGGSHVWGRLLLDGPHHVPLPVGDSEIIARALQVQQMAGRAVTLVSYDRHVLFSARQLGLAAVRPTT
ncbi:PIN domain-containing protein [Quadrisphaera sp. KR29]|uniref:PIN domain-containing protein n=1 Tax=Quadrisphaera sp. KR29 TaxID=3461391 RepID=UPI004044A971